MIIVFFYDSVWSKFSFFSGLFFSEILLDGIEEKAPKHQSKNIFINSSTCGASRAQAAGLSVFSPGLLNSRVWKSGFPD